MSKRKQETIKTTRMISVQNYSHEVVSLRIGSTSSRNSVQEYRVPVSYANPHHGMRTLAHHAGCLICLDK